MPRWYAGEVVKRLRQPGGLSLSVTARTCGMSFHCADDDSVTQYDFVARTARALEVGAPRRSPVSLARLVTASGPALALATIGR